MTDRELVTRTALRRALAVNAATNPLAVVAAAGVAVAALALGVVWLLPLALVVYVALAATAFLDPAEAERVGEKAYEDARRVRAPTTREPVVAGPIAVLVSRARSEESRVLAAIAAADLPLHSVASEVRDLTADLEQSARRAQRLWDYREGAAIDDARSRLAELARATGGDVAAADARQKAANALEDRIRVAETISADLDRFVAETEHLIATLGVVHAQVVRMGVANEPRVQGEIADELRDLRSRVGALAAGMREVDDLRDQRA